jgi:hypothetical protein
MKKAMDHWIGGLMDELAFARAPIHPFTHLSNNPLIHLTPDPLPGVAV